MSLALVARDVHPHAGLALAFEADVPVTTPPGHRLERRTGFESGGEHQVEREHAELLGVVLLLVAVLELRLRDLLRPLPLLERDRVDENLFSGRRLAKARSRPLVPPSGSSAKTYASPRRYGAGREDLERIRNALRERLLGELLELPAYSSCSAGLSVSK